MKIRKGFVSNSSSSSFILKQKYLERVEEKLNNMFEILKYINENYKEGDEVYLDDHVVGERDLMEMFQDIIEWDFSEADNWLGRAS